MWATVLQPWSLDLENAEPDKVILSTQAIFTQKRQLAVHTQELISSEAVSTLFPAVHAHFLHEMLIWLTLRRIHK